MAKSATPLDTISDEWSPDKFRFVDSKEKLVPLCNSKFELSSADEREDGWLGNCQLGYVAILHVA